MQNARGEERRGERARRGSSSRGQRVKWFNMDELTHGKHSKQAPTPLWASRFEVCMVCVCEESVKVE